PELCKACEVKETDRFTVIEGATEDTGYLDMLLMSSCRHYILANSSFSWWGAYLNPSKEKLVIVPSVWFNNQDCRDIYTEEMKKISPEGEWIVE
ncbi:MAG: alpha-1,2-fucosyltransferase, partial [Lachnospiraceae bacterium]|nr:alpha-1,2-fucosyltransferase [Lachnospiraceae bacterium]